MEMPAYLELQNKDFIVNHVTVILLKSNIVDAHCFISNKTKLVVLDKAQEYASKIYR